MDYSIEFEKSITRAMALRAYHKAVKLGVATDPKKQNVFGASYLLTIF